MQTQAIVVDQPRQLGVRSLDLDPAGPADVVVDIAWSGISTGTEKLLWSGRMPAFPGMGYPLVPGYESVGRISAAGVQSGRRPGQLVYVPGARCFGEVRGLFGGSASRVVVPGAKVVPISDELGERGTLLALAATAHHAHSSSGVWQPELIVGHGVLGRLIARLAVLAGVRPVVWETRPERRAGALGYDVIDPADDDRHNYHCICDVSGDASLIDRLVSRLAPGGELVLAGFYDQPLTMSFPPMFLRETRLRVAAQWQPQDLEAVRVLSESGRLSLDGLLTHRDTPQRAPQAYHTAFDDSACLKMILDWSAC